MAKRLTYSLGAVLIAILAYLLLWPSPIDSVAYEPPPKPALEGPLAPNRLLESAELLSEGQVDGPEDVEVDASGAIYTGTVDGRIVCLEGRPKGDAPGRPASGVAGTGQVKTIAATGGRPLGIATAPNGDLIVADAVKGLLSIHNGQVTTLPTDVAGQAVHFADDLDVARDGTIYFSDASDKFGIDAFLEDMLEGRPHGRLLRYDPATKTTTVLLRDLYFANGVALSQHEDFVLVNETYRFRIQRYWLMGDRAGKSEVFVENLPGYPDNITSNRRGIIWLALFTVRNDAADWLSSRTFLKNTLAKLPGVFWAETPTVRLCCQTRRNRPHPAEFSGPRREASADDHIDIRTGWLSLSRQRLEQIHRQVQVALKCGPSAESRHGAALPGTMRLRTCLTSVPVNGPFGRRCCRKATWREDFSCLGAACFRQLAA